MCNGIDDACSWVYVVRFVYELRGHPFFWHFHKLCVHFFWTSPSPLEAYDKNASTANYNKTRSDRRNPEFVESWIGMLVSLINYRLEQLSHIMYYRYLPQFYWFHLLSIVLLQMHFNDLFQKCMPGSNFFSPPHLSKWFVQLLLIICLVQLWS